MDESITVRVPSELKKAVDDLCLTSGKTLTGFVRDALMRELAPTSRTYQLPGFSQAFTDFLASEDLQRRLGRALLLIIDEGGNRAAYFGHIDFNTTQGGLVGICVAGRDNHPWILLRKHISAWYSADHDFTNVLAFLQRQGWFAITYPPR